MSAAGLWSERADAYRTSALHSEGADLELLAEWARSAAGRTALDVATGGGHLARRLREEGFDVVTLDPAPGMRADVLARAEDIPFADASFDVVACRIAPHHFEDVDAAMRELARTSRELVLVEDELHVGEAAEEAARLRDPSHVRCYGEGEWRALFERAGHLVDDGRFLDRFVAVDRWLELTGCAGEEAARVLELVADLVDGHLIRRPAILLRGRR